MTTSVVLMTFPTNSQTYEAFTKLKNVDVEIDDAVLVERDADGRLTVPEGADSQWGSGMLGGSLIGMLVGVLGGPIGVLLGWTAGTAAGALVDADRFDSDRQLVTEMAADVAAGSTAIIAEVSADSPATLDEFVAGFDGTIRRFPREQVLAELEAQQQAAEHAAKAARETLREQHRAEFKEKFHERLQALRERFHR
ncbi:putative membrane protein [Kineosphaera limosa]|uniref:DUF1269 domain-containing protein n=1 Tax=Kineosphaera limosa NBRC 100340 TaxID=1184609 RepID=K6X909_9MICO|nr:DUF1269 domain-containing protein [Kineosphaera limosa]NYE02115.1 putative membrane protein [Kineosphaera limosa]GAB95284.1 hypothetical protein KILIM_018_00310 [Kineosphaera limosa NBRC 100340]